MKRLLEQVAEFHVANDVPVIRKTALPDANRRKLRMDLLKEELDEYMIAEFHDNVLDIADALGDMAYIIAGTALEYGIPLDRVMDEIHRANMSKLGADGKPVHREDGKVMKGPNYVAPDLRHILFGSEDAGQGCAADGAPSGVVANLLENFPEINPLNYDSEDVMALQNWSCDAYDALTRLSEFRAEARKELAKYKNA